MQKKSLENFWPLWQQKQDKNAVLCKWNRNTDFFNQLETIIAPGLLWKFVQVAGKKKMKYFSFFRFLIFFVWKKEKKQKKPEKNYKNGKQNIFVS